MANISKTILKLSKYAAPALTAAMAFVGEVENMKLKKTVAELVKKVSELEKRQESPIRGFSYFLINVFAKKGETK